MKLVSFLVTTPVGTFTRVGAIHGQSIVDLNMAYARWLHDQSEAQPHRLANAQVPSRKPAPAPPPKATGINFVELLEQKRQSAEQKHDQDKQ